MSDRRREPELRRAAWRVGSQTALLVILTLAVVAVLVFFTVVRSQHEQVGRTLDNAIAALHEGSDQDRDGDVSSSPGVQLAVLTTAGVRSSAGVPDGLPDLTVMRAVLATGHTDRRDVQLASGRYALLTKRRGTTVVQAMLSLHEQREEQLRILESFGLASVAGLLLATAAGFWLAGRAVRPMAEALALQRRFVADASHELRTPLTLLSTRAQLLRRRIRSAGRTDDALLRDVDGIVADTKALTDILEELLLAADTRAEVPRVTVDVAALVAAVVAAAAAEADRRGVQLTLRSDEPVRLSAGAPTALKRAVTALIDNALTHAKGQVRVTVTRLATEVVISVRDDGPGLDEDSVPQMFARFASDRREPAAASGRRHYGLGLALVSEVAARHGGRVLAENVPGPQTGADVRLILPSRR